MVITRYLLIIISFFAATMALASESQEELLGSWLFYKYRYQDHESPAPNPGLQQIISFDETGSSRLYYKRADEDWFCDRISVYTYSPASRKLFQQVVWVNPLNHSTCSMDPDMQMGRKTENYAYSDGTEFFLDMPLNDQIITFVWKKINPFDGP